MKSFLAIILVDGTVYSEDITGCDDTKCRELRDRFKETHGDSIAFLDIINNVASQDMAENIARSLRNQQGKKSRFR